MPRFKLPESVFGARSFAMNKHAGQVDDSGRDYFVSHVENVVDILLSVTGDPALLKAAYLHDVVEDCDVLPEELEDLFGKEIADLVMEVTHEGSKERRGYYFPRLKTQRGILLKFADRLSNLSRMEAWDVNRKLHYLRKSRFWKTLGEESPQPDLVGLEL